MTDKVLVTEQLPHTELMVSRQRNTVHEHAERSHNRRVSIKHILRIMENERETGEKWGRKRPLGNHFHLHKRGPVDSRFNKHKNEGYSTKLYHEFSKMYVANVFIGH